MHLRDCPTLPTWLQWVGIVGCACVIVPLHLPTIPKPSSLPSLPCPKGFPFAFLHLPSLVKRRALVADPKVDQYH